MEFQLNFNAQQVAPSQGGGGHPVGKFPAIVSKGEVLPTKNGDGGMLAITFTTEKGSIVSRYNLWNKNPDAVRIAQGELSALCHATGQYTINTPNAQELWNRPCMIEVDYQEQTPEQKKENKPPFVEVRKVLTANGQVPGQAGGAQPQTAAPNQPPAQGWTPPQQAPNAPVAPSVGGQAPQPQNAPAFPTNNGAPQWAPPGVQPGQQAWSNGPAQGAPGLAPLQPQQQPAPAQGQPAWNSGAPNGQPPWGQQG